MIKFGGDMDADSPADPFGLKDEVFDALSDQAAEAIARMPPTSNQARQHIARFETVHQIKLPEAVRDEFFMLLVHGRPIPPLPPEVNFSPSEWPIGRQTDGQVTSYCKEVNHGACKGTDYFTDSHDAACHCWCHKSTATQEQKFFDRYVNALGRWFRR